MTLFLYQWWDTGLPSRSGRLDAFRRPRLLACDRMDARNAILASPSAVSLEDATAWPAFISHKTSSHPV